MFTGISSPSSVSSRAEELVCRYHDHQSYNVLHPGLAKFRPPRSNGGRTCPAIIVLVTIDWTSCGVTRPYQTPAPLGVYIITFPANLCPPMWELQRMRTLRWSRRAFSFLSNSNSRSEFIPEEDSREGLPERSSSSVWASQPSFSRYWMNVFSRIGAAIEQRLSRLLCEHSKITQE